MIDPERDHPDTILPDSKHFLDLFGRRGKRHDQSIAAAAHKLDATTLNEVLDRIIESWDKKRNKIIHPGNDRALPGEDRENPGHRIYCKPYILMSAAQVP